MWPDDLRVDWERPQFSSRLLSVSRLFVPTSEAEDCLRSLFGSYKFHNARNVSNCTGVNLSNDYASETQSDATPSRYSHLAPPDALTTRLLPSTVYIDAARWSSALRARGPLPTPSVRTRPPWDAVGLTARV